MEVADGEEINCIDPDDKQLESLGGAKVTDYLRLDKHKDRSYRFDCAIGPDVDQTQSFTQTLDLLIPDVLSGGNACCFAYGATGSGKTFTMTGSSASPGLIPLGVDQLFAQAGAECAIAMQYVEIYNEHIKDLLQPNNSNLDVREAPGKGTFVAGAANVEVASRDDVEMLLEAGNAFRTTESTQLNIVSSRSHAVLQLRCTLGGRKGKLSLIDLAGSERASKTGVMSGTSDIGRGGTQNNTKRLNEGANINRSLLALANCISALADRAKKGGEGAGGAPHVPYRDSKLTRLLKDSLGGACRTMMIANVSPSSDQFDETLNTLKYADRAKRIKTRKAPPGGAGSRRRLPPIAQGARPPAGSGSAAVAAARRAAGRSAAGQLDGARAADKRHLARMQAGRHSNDRLRRGPPANGSGHARPGLVREVSQEEAAAQTMQRHVRGRLTRKKTEHFRAGDLLSALNNDPRRKQALAKRAALAQAAGDVPASPSRQAPSGRARRLSKGNLNELNAPGRLSKGNLNELNAPAASTAAGRLEVNAAGGAVNAVRGARPARSVKVQPHAAPAPMKSSAGGSPTSAPRAEGRSSEWALKGSPIKQPLSAQPE